MGKLCMGGEMRSGELPETNLMVTFSKTSVKVINFS